MARPRLRAHWRPHFEVLESRCVPALFPTTLALTDLNGGNGFTLEGVAGNDRAGGAVARLGDVNGDGFDDMIIGASYANTNRGAAYVVFGSPSGFPANLDLSSLDGSNGFVLNGVADGDRAGNALAGLGDINGDGLDDMIIGASLADPNGSVSGAAYVVFGRDTAFPASIDLSSLDGSDGFVINGITAGDRAGTAVAGLGDINGDGFDDLLIGAPQNNQAKPGQAFVVFGKNTAFAAAFELSSLLSANGGDGSTGFVLHGVSNDDRTASALAGLGDINGDGFDDLLVGAYLGGGSQRGQAFVVFGRDNTDPFAAELNLSTLLSANGGDGSDGFAINGIDGNDRMGNALAGLGDVNGDGIDDLILGAPFAGAADSSQGEAYVIFGRDTGFAAELSLASLDGSNGFLLDGVTTGDQAGRSVAGLGDINGDGIDDLLVGAIQTGAFGVPAGPGVAYVVFGRDTGFEATLQLPSLDGNDGFILEGGALDDRAGFAVAGLGDVNGDGVPDMLIGAPRADPNGESSGAAYVVFGRRTLLAAGPDKGSGPLVRVFEPDGELVANVLPYPVTFTGGVRVAVGDVTGDDYPDVVMTPGSGLFAQVQIWDGRTQQLREIAGIEGFLAYGPNYLKGVSVAVGDIDNDGVGEIIVAADKGPRAVMIFEGDGTFVSQFFPYGTKYKGGVRVAVGDTEGSAAAEIITVKSSGKPALRVFDAAGVRLHKFSVKGNFVAVGDVDNDGAAEIIVGSNAGVAGRVRIYSGTTAALERTITPYAASFQGGIRVAVVENEGQFNLVTAPGKGTPAVINVFDEADTPLLDSFFAYDADFTGGAFIAAG